MSRYLYEISPREHEVLRLLASGLSYQQIGKTLGMCRQQVGRHVTTMLEKTFVSNGHELAFYAWRNGIVSLDDAWATLQAYNQKEIAP